MDLNLHVGYWTTSLSKQTFHPKAQKAENPKPLNWNKATAITIHDNMEMNTEVKWWNRSLLARIRVRASVPLWCIPVHDLHYRWFVMEI
jgi:hypothetical protein